MYGSMQCPTSSESQPYLTSVCWWALIRDKLGRGWNYWNVSWNLNERCTPGVLFATKSEFLRTNWLDSFRKAFKIIPANQTSKCVLWTDVLQCIMKRETTWCCKTLTHYQYPPYSHTKITFHWAGAYTVLWFQNYCDVVSTGLWIHKDSSKQQTPRQPAYAPFNK